MRRKLDNKAIFYVVIVAIFTLLSYVFDQLVIRQEDKIRITEIEFSNLIDKANELDNLDIQLNNLSVDSYEYLAENLQNRFFNFKNYLKLNFDQYGKENFEKNFSNSTFDLIKKNKDNMLEEYRVTWIFSYRLLVKLEDIFLWNKDNYKPFNDLYNDNREYLDSFIELEEIFEKNKDQFEYKNYSYYDYLTYKDHVDNYTIKHWQDLNRMKILMLENVHRNLDILDRHGDKIADLVSATEENADKKLTTIRSTSNLKNQLILLSIISQILSLFSLLILFRYLIININ